MDGERKEEYLRRIVRALGELQSQEDARNAFTAPEQDWSEICEKIVSLTRGVEVVNGTLYGVYTCRSSGTLTPDEVEDLKWHCCDQWENGWGEGYAHCPREGVSLGLYIHFWQDSGAPLLSREQLRQKERQRARRYGGTVPPPCRRNYPRHLLDPAGPGKDSL